MQDTVVVKSLQKKAKWKFAYDKISDEYFSILHRQQSLATR